MIRVANCIEVGNSTLQQLLVLLSSGGESPANEARCLLPNLHFLAQEKEQQRCQTAESWGSLSSQANIHGQTEPRLS